MPNDGKPATAEHDVDRGAAGALTGHRARVVIRDFLVACAGYDAGDPMTEQADDLVARLTDARLLAGSRSVVGGDVLETVRRLSWTAWARTPART
jgi:hypothetical protein